MFNPLKNKFNKNLNYEDISTIYDIVDIDDHCVYIKKDNILQKVYIYKIEPVTIINMSNSLCNNVIDAYSLFLRNMNCDFQIYIENTNVNINSYFSNIVINESNVNKAKLSKVYKSELEKTLTENNVYICNYYIVISIGDEHNLDEIIKNLYGLCKVGISIERIEGKEKLNNFIYLKINKVDNIC